MAITQDSPFLTPGLDAYAAYAQGVPSAPGQAGSAGVQQQTVWDELMAHFAPTGLPLSRILGVQVRPIGGYTYTGGYNVVEKRPNTGDFKDAIIPMTDEEVAFRDKVAKQVRQTQADRVRLRKLAEAAGLDPDDPIDLGEFWRAGVEQAQKASVVDGREPEQLVWSLLEGWAADGFPGTDKAEQAELERSKESFEPFTTTTTSTNIQLTDPKTARALVTRFLSDELGRDPSDDEIRDFTAGLAKYERDNPAVTTTVSEYGMTDAGPRVVSSESTTSGGADPSGFAADFAEGDRFDAESRGYQAVKYAGVIDALIGG